MKLLGRKIVVTGASQGFGLALAEAFVREGADVFMGARNLVLLTEQCDRLQKLAKPEQELLAHALDVADESSALAFMGALQKVWGALDVLVNNAGIYGPMGTLEDVDWQAWTGAIQVNLMGTVLMCRLCLPLLKKSSAGRIINLSGGGATAPMPRISAYAASKAAVVRFTETLAEELQASGIEVNAVAPGAMNTKMLDELLAAGLERVGEAHFKKAQKQKAEGGVSVKRGAALCVQLATAEGAGITGRLVSAVWDPWQKFGGLKGQINASDVYTLRRIAPADRGFDFPEPES